MADRWRALEAGHERVAVPADRGAVRRRAAIGPGLRINASAPCPAGGTFESMAGNSGNGQRARRHVGVRPPAGAAATHHWAGYGAANPGRGDTLDAIATAPTVGGAGLAGGGGYTRFTRPATHRLQRQERGRQKLAGCKGRETDTSRYSLLGP